MPAQGVLERPALWPPWRAQNAAAVPRRRATAFGKKDTRQVNMWSVKRDMWACARLLRSPGTWGHRALDKPTSLTATWLDAATNLGEWPAIDLRLHSAEHMRHQPSCCRALRVLLGMSWADSQAARHQGRSGRLQRSHKYALRLSVMYARDLEISR
jgi:hypothetical protein